jgi:hypothetical protein
MDWLDDETMSADETLRRFDELEAEILALGDAAYAASQVPDDGLPVDPATVYMPNLGTKFLRGAARLAEMLADPGTCAEVDAIVEEMRKVDVLGPDEDGPKPASKMVPGRTFAAITTLQVGGPIGNLVTAESAAWSTSSCPVGSLGVR